MATLRVYRGDQFVAPFELGEGRTRIGRGTDNHLVLEDHDKQVSRVHAEIWHERGRYVIADLNSQNGVWIGERQIKTEEPLPENVWVTIGPYRLMLMPDEQKPYTPEDLDGAEMTRESGAFVEPTQLAGPAATVPPASQRSYAPEAASAKSHGAQPGHHTQTVKPAAAATKPRGNTIPILAAVAALLVLGVVGILMFRNRGNSTPEATQDPPVAAATTSVTTTSVPAAPAPPPEFQDHLSKAESFIAAGDKTSAAAENAAALALVTDDAGALAQRDRIQQMPDPARGQTPPGTPGTKPDPVPTGPETLRAVARPGESEKERASREKTARTQLDEGRRALNERQYDAAITALNAAILTSNRQDFGNVPGEAVALLKQARTSKSQAEANARRAEAVTALEEARSLAASDPLAANTRLQRARSLDAELEGLSETGTLIVAHARTQGAAAVASAKNLDRANRTDPAIKEYERAVRLLELVPGEQPDLALARQRIAALKGGK